MTIQQPIPVNVAQLFPALEKTDPAKTVHADCHSAKALRIFFDSADRAEAAWTEQRC